MKAQLYQHEQGKFTLEQRLYNLFHERRRKFKAEEERTFRIQYQYIYTKQ